MLVSCLPCFQSGLAYFWCLPYPSVAGCMDNSKQWGSSSVVNYCQAAFLPTISQSRQSLVVGLCLILACGDNCPWFLELFLIDSWIRIPFAEGDNQLKVSEGSYSPLSTLRTLMKNRDSRMPGLSGFKFSGPTWLFGHYNRLYNHRFNTLRSDFLPTISQSRQSLVVGPFVWILVSTLATHTFTFAFLILNANRALAN